MPLEIGVLLPTSSPDPEQPIPPEVQTSARFAEEAGLDSIWSIDHLVVSSPILDSTVVLGAAAGATERIAIGFNVMLIALRPLAWAAKQISTLQHVSAGRLLLGVGTGNPAHGDIGWRAAGASFTDRGRRTDEALRRLPDLVTGKPAALDDEIEVTLAPGTSMPPLLVAGNGPAARRRAATFADGWVSLGLSPDDVASGLVELRQLAASRSRAAPSATVVAPELDADPTRAAARLHAYAEAGVERVVLAPTGLDWRHDYAVAARIRESL